MSREIPYKIYLEENEMPKQWYNVRADMKKKPAPLLNPATGKPMTAEELGVVFVTSWYSRSWTIRRHTSISRRRSVISIKCIVRHRWCGHIAWRRNWILRQRSTISLKEIIRAGATS